MYESMKWISLSLHTDQQGVLVNIHDIL